MEKEQWLSQVIINGHDMTKVFTSHHKAVDHALGYFPLVGADDWIKVYVGLTPSNSTK